MRRRQALDCGALQGHGQVADAYFGVDTIALYIARYDKKVRGYEVVPGAVRDAEANAALNGKVYTLSPVPPFIFPAASLTRNRETARRYDQGHDQRKGKAA
ncbi:hypothetical protein [Desulfoscipio gibsoniae]|uniref:hypothetical protein n=1 Tax=Desulfoscipio gibsoniae TaxID=102134 RepID=UPI000232B35A|nr:hypothetical protein [Desulfoscipio gibsoniae]